MTTGAQMKRFRCRNTFCPNRYDDTIGHQGAFGKHKTGAVCIPCLYAEQMVHHGQTIAQVESVPHLMKQFADLLHNTGWTWQDLKDAYSRVMEISSERATERTCKDK